MVIELEYRGHLGGGPQWGWATSRRKKERGGDPEIDFFFINHVQHSQFSEQNSESKGMMVMMLSHNNNRRERQKHSPPLSLSLPPPPSPPPPPSTPLICVHLIHIWKTSDIVTTHDGKPAKSSHK
jgi:hypothetical protein